MHGFYYRCVFRDNEMVEAAALKEMDLTAWEELRQRASNKKMNEQKKQERRGREEMASKQERLGNALAAAKETIAKPEKVVREYERNQGAKSGTAKKESSRWSGGAQHQTLVQK